MKYLPGSLALLFAATLPATSATVLHYWDFEGDFSDKVGSSDGTAGADVSTATGAGGGTAAIFPTTITGGGSFDSSGYVGITPTIPSVGGGTGSFAFSYWVRLDFDGSTNARGIFDFSSDQPLLPAGTADGPQSLYIQTGTNAGNLAFRVDGTTGAAVGFVPVSAFEGTAGSPTGSWFLITANFDPSGTLDIHLNGSATPAASVSATGVGSVSWQTPQYLGAFNVNNGVERGLGGGLDEVAIYDGTLSTDQMADLFSGALKPNQIPEPSIALLGALGALGLIRRRR